MKTSQMMRCLDLLSRLVGDEDITISIKNESGEITSYPINSISYSSREIGVVISNVNENNNRITIKADSNETK